MDRARLLQQFDALAETPDAVEKLRTFVFDFAVRGRLVEQNPKDTPASELLKQIEVNKERLVKNGKIKAGTPLPQVENAPYEIPSGWEWAALGNTGQVFNGNSVSESVKLDLSKVKDGLPFIATKDVGYGREGLAYENGLRVPLGDADYKVAHKHAILICAEGGSAGKKMGQTDRDICFGNKLLANEVWEGIQPRFILSVYQSSMFFRELSSRMTGIIGGIARSEFLTLPIPIPPPEEQQRIMAKVEELLALCDELESRQTAAREHRTRLVRSALDHLTSAQDESAFKKYSAFCLQHSELLFDSVPALQQTILSLAVAGRLVPQNNRDKPASELVRTVQGLRNAPPPNPVQASEKPFAIPASWQWVRLDQMIESMANGLYKPARFYSETGTACVRMYNIQDGQLDLAKLQRLDLTEKEIKQYLLEPKDLIVNRVNSRELVGKAAIVDKVKEPLVFEAMNIRVRFLEKTHFPDYANVLFRTDRIRASFQGDAKQAIGQASINQPQVASVLVPLPPLAEQQRIVAKVDELLRWCDALEARLTAAQTTATHLLDATLRQILESKRSASPVNGDSRHNQQQPA